MIYFIGVLDGARKIWGVRVPDVPGCHGGGDTPEAAIADATSALRDMADIASGVRPRDHKEILADPSTEFDAAGGEVLVMIPLLADSGRPVKANISLDAGLLEAIDAEAKRRGLTRSSFLASAAREKITGGG